MTFRPMLAAAVKDTSKLVYPLLASVKFDGVRCIIDPVTGKALSRSLKPIPNPWIRNYLEARAKSLAGADGELMLAGVDASFQAISSAVMSRSAEPPKGWFYAVFDNVLRDSYRVAEGLHVQRVEHVIVRSEIALLEYEALCLAEGYEGVMLRKPGAPYKHGRSTLKEAALLKLKRFDDAEAVVVDVVELQRNENEKSTNELGLTKRSTSKVGKVPGGVLGALVVVGMGTSDGISFEIGSGFTEAQRCALWEQPPIGRTVKYKFQKVGTAVKPRSPVFVGFREEEDMSND